MKTVSIACVTDEGYAPGLAVMVRSLLEHLNSSYSLHVSVIDGGVREETQNKVRDSWTGLPVTVTWLHPDTSGLRDLPINGSVTHMTYARLLLPELIQAPRLLYLDCDLLVRSDIAPLWETDLAGKVFAAVQDIGCLTVADEKNGLRLYRELGIPKEHPYCNGGLLLLDLDAWREEKISECVFTYLRTYPKAVRWCDQDGINAIAWDRWLNLPARWNSLLEMSGTLNWKKEDIDPETLKKFLVDPTIVHFIGPDKPWKKGCRHPRAAEYGEVLGRTAFAF